MADVYNYEFNDGRRIEITQDTNGPNGTGSTVWDTSLVLGKLLERVFEENNPRDSVEFDAKGLPTLASLTAARKIIEVGAGTGMLSIILGKLWGKNGRPCTILATDGRTEQDIAQNIAANGFNDSTVTLKAAKLEFGKDTASLEPPYDLILASDLLAWPNLYDSLAETLVSLSRSNPATMILLGFERRNFEQEAKFFARFGPQFKFRDVKPEEQDSNYTSEDIYVFIGCKRE